MKGADSALVAPFVAMLATVLLMPLLIRVAPRLGLLAQPAARKVHVQPTPEVGGIAMSVSVLLVCALWWRPDASGIAAALAVLLVTVLGAWDDRFDLHFAVRIGVQVVAATVVALSGFAVIGDAGFTGTQELSMAVAVPLTVLALVSVTNAVNFTDGLDGLAGGSMLLIGGVLALLAYRANASHLLLVCLAILGALVGFLRFNTHPARVFMGDSGAYFLGFAFAVVAIRLSQRAYSPALPLLLFGLPIFDLLLVSISRILGGRSPFHAGRDHTHHRLLELGLQHYQTVVVTYLVCAAFVGLAYLFRYSDSVVICSVFVTAALGLTVAYRVARNRMPATGVAREGDARGEVADAFGRWLAREPAAAPAAGKPVAVQARASLPRLLEKRDIRRLRALAVVVVTMPIYVIWSAASTAHALDGFAVTTLVASLGAGLLAMVAGRWRLAIMRFTLYLAAATVVYLGHVAGLAGTTADAVVLALLGTSVLLAMGLSRGGFPLTPMDALLALLLVLSSLPAVNIDPAVLFSCAKSLVLFYGVELVLLQGGLLQELLPGRWRRGSPMAQDGCVDTDVATRAQEYSVLENRHA